VTAGAVTFRVDDAAAGQRVDLALAAAAGIPRAQARRWIDEGRVRLNARACRASQRVQPGDALEAVPPQPVAAGVAPEPIALSVLFEDGDLIVIDKPAGLVVHPAPGHAQGTLVNALLHHCHDLAGIGGVLRPGIVHRLDKGTSGVLVAAKNDAAHRGLAAQWKGHAIERVYRAVVRAAPVAAEGRIDRSVGRHPRDRKRMSVAAPRGRAARTAWRVVDRFPRSSCAELEVRPETGRTHQIRVHLASAGMPILGDPVYGGRGAGDAFGLERPALHAAVLGFAHPSSGVAMRFEAPLPADLAQCLATLRARESVRGAR
jgi:23S rRNA pseudouridine1911/1915/1917 synthase